LGKKNLARPADELMAAGRQKWHPPGFHLVSDLVIVVEV